MLASCAAVLTVDRPSAGAGLLRCLGTLLAAVLVAAIAVLVLALPAAAQPPASTLPGLAAAAAPAGEPGAIAGRVVTLSGEPVTDAEVQLVDLRRSTATAGDASFRFDDVPPGQYLLEAVSVRFGKAIARAVVKGGAVAEVEIVIGLGIHTEEVVVTASPDVRSQLELAQPTSVLSGEELRLQLQPSLGETLTGEPGVHSTYFGPGASRPVIRGLGGDRVRMLQGGLDSGDVSGTSPDHAVSADPLAAERIEVVRGPATLLYGSNAIGGVVNVLDGRIPDAVPARPLGGMVEVRGGTVADERAGSLALEGGAGSWAWHLDGFARKTGDYAIPGFAESQALRAAEHEGGEDGDEEPRGTLANSDIEAAGGSAGLSFVFGDVAYLGVSFAGFDTEYGIPGSGHAHGEGEGEEGEEEEGDVRIDLVQRRVDLEGEVSQPFSVFRGARFRLGITDYEHRELEGAERQVGTEFLNDAWESRLELVQRERGAWTGSLGVQASQRDLEARGEEAFIPPTDSENWAVFAFQELRQGSLRWQLGGRFESHDVATSDAALPDRSFDGVSGSLGLVWAPAGDWTLGLSVARSMKFPNPEELYSHGAHFATGSFEVGNPQLGEETSLGVDLSLRKSSGRVSGALTLFSNRFDDFIFQAFTGEEEDGLPVVLYSQADARFQGAELEGRVGLYDAAPHHVDLRLTADYVEAELRDTGEPLPRIPPLRFGVGLHYDGDRLHSRVEVRRVEEQDEVAPGETPTDGYTLLGASVGYRFFVGEQVVDLLLRGTNLTDEEARVHTSFLKDRVPLPGRDVSLAVRLSF